MRAIQEETNFKKMLGSNSPIPIMTITLKEITEARKKVKKVEINDGMMDLLIKLRRELAHQGIFPTDRTYNTTTTILKAEAFLSGRKSIIEDDFDILRHALWVDPKDEKTVWSVILDQISPEKGKILSLYEKAVTTANETLSEKDSKKRVEKGIDTASKLKDVKKKIGKYIEAMEKKKKDTTEVKIIDQKLNKLLGKVFTESCGIDANIG